MKATLVHLDPRQKSRLARRARLRGNSFSQEVREALDLYLDLPQRDGEEIAVLARAANQSADRMIANLDDAIATVRRFRNRMERK